MKAEDLLLGIVISGAALTLFYIIAECLSWRMVKAAENRAMSELRELYKKLHVATKPFTRPFSGKGIKRK
jgi:hypothetical protein